MYNAEYVTFSATINVTYTEGATCTCTLGDKVLTAPDTTGFYAFTVGAAGTWAVKIEKEDEPEPKTTTVEITSNGQTEAVEVTFLEIVPWSTGTVEQISEMLAAHYAGQIDIHTLWAIGDERTVELTTGESIQLVLMHPTYPLADSGTAAYVVGMKNSLALGGYMNETDTCAGGWDACVRRTWCNNDFRNSIPETLRTIFKQFRTTAANGMGNTVVTSDDYFALPAEKEIFGTNTQGNATAESTLFQFEYYKTASNRIKTAEGTGVYSYWVRSPFDKGTQPKNFCAVSSAGESIYRLASWTLGISPFGCI